MNIKLTFGKGYDANLLIGSYTLRAMKPFGDNAPFYYTHPYPYMATVWLPEDQDERKAIYSFVTQNSDRIKEEFGLEFEFFTGGFSFEGYEKECSILGLDKSSTLEDAKRQYWKLSKEWHPDVFASGTDEERKTAEEKFKQINAAYEKVKDVKPFIDCYMYVTDINKKKDFDLYEKAKIVVKKERMASLRF